MTIKMDKTTKKPTEEANPFLLILHVCSPGLLGNVIAIGEHEEVLSIFRLWSLYIRKASAR